MTDDARDAENQGAIDRAYTKHISLVGEVAYHWNILHERLGELFCIAAGTNQRVGMAIWHSVQSDRAQREMLLAALRANDGDLWGKRPQAKAAIKWLADYVTGTLADRRNDAIHAPCEVVMAVYRDDAGLVSGAIEVGASYFLGNPRATKLSAKTLQEEFAWYADTTHTLSHYAGAIITALMATGGPWPEKPRLPSLGQSQRRSRQGR